MTRKDQNKILDNKIESNINQYKVDRLNAEIPAFSSGDLIKYEFLTRKDLKYKPNALGKARFEFSPLVKVFSTGLDKHVQGYQEEGVIKLLKDIRDSLSGNVIIPARLPRPNDDGDDNGDDDADDNGDDNGGDIGDDNGDDNGDDKTSYIDSSWINNLQLYKKIASEVFSRYNGDKDSFEFFSLRTFIDNIHNERAKNKKDAREEFKTVKKNIKSEALKQIVKELEQAIFGYDGEKDKEELEETEELDKRFKNLISKKRFESLKEAEELDKRFKNLISKKRLESFKSYSKKAEYIDTQIRVNALRKKLNNLPEISDETSNETSDETSDETIDETSDETSDDNNNNNDNDDSENNPIINFVDRVLKKVSKKIVNDDNKDDSDNKNDDNKNNDNKKLLKLSKENADLKKMKASKNLSNKQISDAKNFLKLVEKKLN